MEGDEYDMAGRLSDKIVGSLQEEGAWAALSGDNKRVR